MAVTRGALAQAVVLCGGLGTRLRDALGDVPKALVPIAGRPLLEHLLLSLGRAGTREVLLLAGHRGERVATAARALAPAGLRVETLVEAVPLGTAGALHLVAARLAPRFLLLFGDVYAALDWRRFASHAGARGGLGTVLLHRTDHPEDCDTVALDDAHRVVGWSRRGALPAGAGGAALGNAALAVLHRDVLDYVPRERPSDLYGEVLPALVDAGAALHGYTTSEYVRDVGTPARLAEVDADVRSGRARLRAELALLDRDGVLAVERDGRPALRPAEVRLLPRAARAVRTLNEAGIRTALVTNQAAVARGLMSPADLEAVHARLAALLAAEGAHLDLVLACPHHPETHHAEGVPALRGPCACRKPRTGMVERALAELGVRPWRAVVVGDATVDLALARRAGLASIAVATGKGATDRAFPARPVWRSADVDAAARWLTGQDEDADR
ncbi:MAG: HAD-IIIA family hydrolase [Myxococcales bacterium]|nr:HAD-IIIA family hydrolase [Myxococcales bacterium]